MFSAALNLAPAAASSLATAAQGAAQGVGGTIKSNTGSTGGGIGGGLGGMSFMSPLADAKNTMEKRLGNVTGTMNKNDPNVDMRGKQPSMVGPGGLPTNPPGTRPHHPNMNPSLPSSGNKKPFGGVAVLPATASGIRQPNVPLTSTMQYNHSNQYAASGQNNTLNMLNAHQISSDGLTHSHSSTVPPAQPSSTGGMLSSSNTNAQSKRCRFASVTSSTGNETTEVPLVGQNVALGAIAQPSEVSNLMGGGSVRRSRSPGPKQTPQHLLSNVEHNRSPAHQQHLLKQKQHDPSRTTKNNQPYSSQSQTMACSTNPRENQSTLISSAHSSYPLGSSVSTIANNSGMNVPLFNQNITKDGHHTSSEPTRTSGSSILNSKVSTYDTHSLKKEGIKFSAPLMMEQAEELMILASTGKPLPEGLQIKDSPPIKPNGGTMYLIQTSDPSAKDAQGICSDGYPWIEILYQADLTTPRGNCIDYRHYYIGCPTVPSMSQNNPVKTRTSSRFRREAYTLGNLTLFAYIGDEREGAVIGGSRASSVNTNRDGNELFNSLPRSHRYDAISSSQSHVADFNIPTTSHLMRPNPILGERSTKKTNLYGSNMIQGIAEHGRSLFSRSPAASLRPRSLDRNDILNQRTKHLSGSHLDNLDLHRLQNRTSSASDMSKKGVSNLYGSSLSSAIISSSLRSSTMLAKANNYQSHSTSTFEELTVLADELAGGKLVKNLTLFPSIQITLVHPDMTREFEQSCQVLYADHPDPSYLGLEEGILLFYDITFPLGRIHATLLTYINCCYEGNPVMPLAVNLHERKFKSSHQLFWARIVGDIPALQKYRFPLMIDDAEPAVHLAVRTQAPNLVQLEGWTHRFRDIDRHLRSKGYGEEAVSYYKACIGYLLSANSKQAMHDRYRKEFECVWPKDFVHYYRNKLLPRSGRLGRWAMAKMNIKEQQYFSPHTNPQERFHMLCRNFSGWETLTVDQLVRCFHLLFVFFVSETTSGNGSSTSAYVIKSTFRPHFLQMLPRRSHTNYLTNTLHPADIREYVLSNYPKENNSSKRPFDPLRPFYMAASSAEHGGIKHHAGIEDVLQLGDALENMLYDDEDNDPLYHANKISTDDMDGTGGFDAHLSNLLSSHGLGSSGGGTMGRSTARFLSNGNLPSSLIGNVHQFNRHQQVPSPAPNGRVPSPAPGDVAAASYGSLNSSQFPQASFLGNASSIASSVGNNITLPMRSTHSSLSTIPEVPAELNRSSNSTTVINPSKNVSHASSSISKGHRQPLMSQPNQKRTMFQQENRYHPSMSKTIGGGVIRGVHPSTDKFQNPASTRFNVPLTGHSMDMMNNYPPDILVHSTSSTVVPSTSVSNMQPISTSNNWQEQSFDSSIVTESHYDASFESEIPPMGLSIDRGLGQNGASNIESMPINQVSSGISMSSQPNVSNTAPLTTSQRQQKNVFQQRKGGSVSAQNSLVTTESIDGGKMANKKGGGFGISGFGNNASIENYPRSTATIQGMNPAIGGSQMSSTIQPGITTSSHNPQSMSGGRGIGAPPNDSVAGPNSLMLWKKVQHYVVVGGAFVQAGQQQAASTRGGASQGHLPQGVQPTANPTTLHH